jgi:glycosyltransferase involved in cell wall biosynthesis
LNFGLSRAFVEIKSDIPKIGICHGTDTQVAQKYDFFKNNLIEITDQVDHLVFPAKNMMSDFFEVYEKEKPFSIFPHGIPNRFFDSHELHQQEKTLRLLYAGRLNTYKGADIAIESLSYVNTDVTLNVIGNEDEPGFMDKLKEIVHNNSLEDVVSFYPQISREELIEKYSQYDAILIPSRYLEAFSLTSIEAQSRGLPVIYGNGGGISNVVGDSGYLIEDNRPQTLAKIIDEININRDLLGELRNKGYSNAENFRLSNQIKSLLELSTKLINKDH